MKEINISQVDALFSNGIYPLELLFYYRQAFSTKKMRTALRKLSTYFWPLFGEYRDGVIVPDKFHEENHYDEEAVSQETDIREIEEKGYEAYSRFCLPDLKRLFFLKVIRLKNGLILIPKMNHVAGDGYSYFYFLSLLAALSQPTWVPFRSFSTAVFFRPHHRRTALKDFSFKGVELTPGPQNERFTVEFDDILRKDVRSMIKEVASSGNTRISSNDVLSALALKKLVGRQNEAWGDDVHLTIPIDVRPHIKEYGPKFFGNGIMLHTIGFQTGFVQNSLAKEIAVQIRKSMPFISKETYIDYLTGLEAMIALGKSDEFRPFDPNSGCLVTNLSKLPAEKLNFGGGPPEIILPLTAEKNSAAILAKKENYILRYAY